MEITDNQLTAICVVAGTIVVIFLAIKTNAFEFILGNLKIKGKKNNPKEISNQNNNPTLQANNNKDSNMNFGSGTQTLGEQKKKKPK